ncbi:UNVERIFIED_ORG: superfamily II DNA/RNA helicase [Methylorubrum zatmanii]
MRPEANARRVLSVTRSKAKMYEYKVPEEAHIVLPQNPNVLLPLAVGMLGDGAAEIAATFIESGPTDQLSESRVYPASTWDAGDNTIRDTSRDSLRFSATYFDSYLEAKLDVNITSELALLCASSYELGESIGSARVIARRTEIMPPQLANALGLFIHKLLLDEYTPLADGYYYSTPSNALLLNLRQYLDGAENEVEIQRLCAELRLVTYRQGEAEELLYGDIAIAIISRRMANSSRRKLPPSSGLSLELWQPALAKPSFPRQLWPAQQRICDAGLLMGRSAVIQMPTSAGKTRATELIIRSSFLANRTQLAVIVAPFRSLCHEIRSDLSSAFEGEYVDLNEATDTFDVDIDFDVLLSRRSVLILTPEKLLYILRREPEFSQQIGLIIYDEGHQFDGLSRGPTYELLLTSLKIALRSNAQVVFISAVIGNAPAIAGWLIGDETAVVDGAGLLPTPKSIAFSSWQDARGRLQYVSPLDPDEEEFYVPRVIQQMALGLQGRERKPRHFPEKTGLDIGLYLSIQLASNGSSAVFCGRKDSASNLCERAVEIFQRNVQLERPRVYSNTEELDKIACLIRSNLGAHAGAAVAAEIGVLQHHGNVPHGIRVAVEHAMKKQFAKVVVCTSTLAQGVNFPIRYLIVTTVHQGKERILVRDFHNLMGRAGRAGMHTEGGIIFASPEVYDERTSQLPWKWRTAKELLNSANSEPCNSAILRILDSYVQENSYVSYRLTPDIAQYLVFASPENIRSVVDAAVQQNASINDKEFERFLNERARVIQSIAAYLIAHESPDSGGQLDDVDRLFASTLADYLADAGGRAALKAIVRSIFIAINEQASSLDRRTLIRKSPLPPAAIIALDVWLAANVDAVLEAISQGALARFAEAVILRHVTSKVVADVEDKAAIAAAFQMWIAGISFGDIYSELSRRKVKIRTSNIKIDDVVALCEGAFGFEASMIAASLADLSEAVDDNTRKAFGKLQRSLRYGLSEPGEVALYEAGFSDRFIVQAIAEKFGGAATRSRIKAICRDEREDISTRLRIFPSYFTEVLNELAA